MENLKIKVATCADGLEEFQPDLFSLLHNISSWKILPEFVESGRTAWHGLQKPYVFKTSTGTYEILSLKLKGVGLGLTGKKPQLPSVVPFYRSQPHLGFDQHGAFVSIDSSASPLGGITLTRAMREYQMAEAMRLTQAGSILPLVVFEIENEGLRFSDESLGIVISGLPSASPMRADGVLDYGTTHFRWGREVETWASRLNIDTSVEFRGALLWKLSNLYAAELRKFHFAGGYRYSGGLGNFAFSSQHDSVYLVDFDSCQWIRDCGSPKLALEIIRDVMSGLYHLAGRLLRREYIESFPLEALEHRGYSIFNSYLRGYFDDVDERLIDKACENIDRYFTETRKCSQELFRSASKQVARDASSDYQAYRNSSASKTWFDAEAMQVAFITALHPIYQNSTLVNRFGNLPDIDLIERWSIEYRAHAGAR